MFSDDRHIYGHLGDCLMIFDNKCNSYDKIHNPFIEVPVREPNIFSSWWLLYPPQDVECHRLRRYAAAILDVVNHGGSAVPYHARWDSAWHRFVMRIISTLSFGYAETAKSRANDPVPVLRALDKLSEAEFEDIMYPGTAVQLQDNHDEEDDKTFEEAKAADGWGRGNSKILQ